ncbi:TPA: ComEC/Rec2 family competence protein, partial [Campylobacter jejuni]
MIFNILLEYNNFLKFKNQKHYFINNALLTHQYTKYNKKNKKYWVLK